MEIVFASWFRKYFVATETNTNGFDGSVKEVTAVEFREN